MSIYEGMKKVDRLFYQAFTKYLWFKVVMGILGVFVFIYIIYTFVVNFIVLFCH